MSKIRTYKCSSCGAVEKIDLAKDDRAIFAKIECLKCGGIAPLFIDKTKVIGDIEDVENNNPVERM